VAVSLLFGLAAIASARDVVLIGGRAMVPLRSLRDHFGATISYDSRHGISISLDYRTARLRPGYRQAWIDDRAFLLDADIVIINGVTYVPVNFVRDAFGYDCRWDARSRQVIIIQPRTQQRVVLDCERDGNRYEPRRDNRDWERDRRYDRDRTDYQRDDRKDGQRYDRGDRKDGYDRDDRDWKSDDKERGKGKAKGKGHDKGRGKGHGC
jgi:hypothetical protein